MFLYQININCVSGYHAAFFQYMRRPYRHLKEVSRRLVDFLSGVAYANNGQIKRVANSTFIITPYNVDIMGDLLDELENNGAFY